jgi:hypothetical protein
VGGLSLIYEAARKPIEEEKLIRVARHLDLTPYRDE